MRPLTAKSEAADQLVHGDFWVTMQAKNLGPGHQVVIGGCGRQTPPPPVSSPVPVRNLALLLE